MSGVVLARKEASERRRIAILDAARTVFARQGYADTVVEDIAAQAGIGKGTLYLYFPSKEQIYFAALLEDARRLDTETREAMAKAPTWREAVSAYIMVRLRYLEEHGDFLRIFLTELRSMCMLGRPLNGELFRLVEDGEAQLAQVFSAAAARKEIRSIDPELAAMMVCDVTRGLMERRLRVPSRPAIPDDAEFALELLARGLQV